MNKILKSLLIFGFIFILISSLFSQIRTGNIYGKIVDTTGAPLPGVTVTLTSILIAPIATVTSSEGAFRFVSLPPGKDYAIKAELQGFKTMTQSGIIVEVGGNVSLTLTMEVAPIAEEITVTAVTPVVDAKKTTVGQNVTQEMLQSLPTARDPWVVLQMVPSIIVDRENIGGAESGQQSFFFAKGVPDRWQYVWAMDGVVITDPAAVASPTYFDFDAFEEMNIVTGGADVSIQTGGVALNIVTRRGGNKVSLGGRYYMTDSKFQADNLTADLKKQGVIGINKVNAIKDYGFNVGGPFIKDKAWWWFSAGSQDIKTTIIYGTRDDTLLTNYAGKVNLQLIPQNRLEMFFHIGNKEKWGRSGTAEYPEGLYQGGRFRFGSPIAKFQDEHMFGDNLYLSVKYAYSNAGFNLTPMTDLKFEQLGKFDIKNRRWNTQSRYWVNRPLHQFHGLANYFNDNLFGAAHDIKVGFEYSYRRSYTEAVWAGNAVVYYNYVDPTADITGDGKPDIVPGIQGFNFWRGYYRDHYSRAISPFFSDTITFGRFNLILGLRYDDQFAWLAPFGLPAVVKDSPAWKNNVTSKTADLLDKLLPPVQHPEVKPDYKWVYWSPRLGLTYDVFGDGKTIAKLSFARYGQFLPTWGAWRFEKLGTGGWMFLYWMDNGDKIIDFTELYWLYMRGAGPSYKMYRVFDSAGNFIGNWSDAAGIYWGGYDYRNPTKLTEPYYKVDKDAKPFVTWEYMATLEREIFKDFGVGIDLTYKRFTDHAWDLWYYPDTGKVLSQDDYMLAGYAPSSIGGFPMKEGAGKPWYVLKKGVAYTPYRRFMKRPDFYDHYYGIDLRFNKRLSNKWMLTGSFTWQNQSQNLGSKGYLDPTNLWAFDGKLYAPFEGGASGKISQFVFSRWLVKLAGMYQFPFDINASFVFIAREGFIVPEYASIVDTRLPNPLSRSNTLYFTEFGSEQLPVMWRVDLRVEKMIKFGDTGRIYLMADVFNPFNSDIINRRYPKYHGTYYVAENRWVPYILDFQANEILNPRLLRVGVRFTF
ncbi:MAG: carboxypeptidase regulatory-like domain-containing protein [Acidobacteriota bacterium]